MNYTAKRFYSDFKPLTSSEFYFVEDRYEGVLWVRIGGRIKVTRWFGFLANPNMFLPGSFVISLS